MFVGGSFLLVDGKPVASLASIGRCVADLDCDLDADADDTIEFFAAFDASSFEADADGDGDIDGDDVIRYFEIWDRGC
jgi:hypothetical protein